METTLEKNFVLFRVSMKTLSTKRIDENVSKEIDKQKNGNKAGKYYKLIIGEDFSDLITKIQGKIRTLVYQYTFPYFSSGFRILSLEQYKKFMEKLKTLEISLNENQEKFFREYENMRNDSIARQGELFNPLEFPSIETMKSKYNTFLEYEFAEIPKNDFLVSLEQKEIEKLQETMNKQKEQAIENIVSDLWKNTKEILERLKEALDKDRKITDTTLEKALEIADIINSYNIKENKELKNIADSLKKDLKGIDNIDTKTDKEAKSEYAKKVEKTLKKINEYI